MQDLQAKLPKEFDLGLFPAGSEQAVAFNQVLNEAAEALRGRESRKVGIERSGLHWLVAIILEAIQQQYWVLPQDEFGTGQWLDADEKAKGRGRLH